MDFKDIKDKYQLASFLGIEYRILTYVLFSKKALANYKTFEVPKKNGSTRCINAPLEPLKGIQRRLAKKLIKIQEEHYLKNSIVQGFTRKRGIISNAKNHRNKKFIINMDLENFFDSIHFGRVKGYFHKNKHFELPDAIAGCLANLVCYNGRLPQGAPSSPVITNLICAIMDRRIAAVAKKYKMTYTRYADDLTFSTNLPSFIDKQTSFFIEIGKIVEENGFALNLKKTRISLRDSRQEVTGLVVNHKIGVKREFYKLTRAILDHIFKGEYCEFSMNEIEGRLAFINQIDLYNNHHTGEIKNINKDNFNAREKQYQLFLFYKYFCHPEKPMIFTEGKTDVIYIKSALKKYCSWYPNLIQRRADDSFEFLVSFLRRTPRLEFFLGISPDGADSMKKFSDFYIKKQSIFNFFKAKNIELTNPVILVFDNENVEGRPLRGFLKNAKKDLVDGQLSIHVTDNLYLATIPLVNNKSTCEMEDLFDDEVLNHVIDGKTFSRKDGDRNKNYGKHIFYQFVLHNYKSINFKNFKPLLDSIDTVVKGFNKEKGCLVEDA